MASSLPQQGDRRHPVLPDIGRPRMAKADVRNLDIDVDWLQKLGAAWQKAVKQVFETNDIAARELVVDASEFGKWMSGGRRAQLDKLLAHRPLRLPLLLALAQAINEVDGNVEVVTEIRMRREA